VPEWLNDWAKRFWADFLEVLSGEPAREILDKLISWVNAIWNSLGWDGLATYWDNWKVGANIIYQDKVDELARLIRWEIEVVTGFTIQEAMILSAIDGKPDNDDRVELGAVFADPFLALFDVGGIRAGYASRTPGDAEMNNLKRFMGANLRLQLGGMGLNSISSVLPGSISQAVHDLPEKIDRVLGWEDLMEEMIQEPIQALVSEGMRLKFLRETRPTDLSFLEGARAYWAGRLDRATLNKIMDNLGYRDDVRDFLIEDAETSLSEGNVQGLFEARLITESDVTAYFRSKGHGAGTARQKTETIINSRLWDLLGKVDAQYLSLYKDCVVSKTELQQWLAGRGWTAQEQDAAIALQELERNSRSFLSDSDLAKALELGLLDTVEVKEYLACKGLTDIDATIKVILMLEPDLPKDCRDKIKPGDYSAALAAIINLLLGDITNPPPPALLKLANCLGVFVPPTPDLPDDDEDEKKAKLPSGTFSTMPSSADVGDIFRLVWNFTNADSVEIDNGIGAVEPQGTRFITASANVVYHAVVKNAEGEKRFQASVLVRQPAPAKPVKLPLPTVSLSVSPGRLIEGEQYAIQWQTENADQVFLDEGRGPVAVATSGVRFAVADKSMVYTVSASGPGGQRTRSDSLIVRPRAEGEAVNVVASLAISPGKAKVGDRVELKWFTQNADAVRLTGLAGTETLPPSGARIIVAEADKVVSLTATNVAANVTKTVWDALIVNQPDADTPTDAPAPTASLTVRPSKTKAGEQVAIEWRTTHADRVELTTGEGTRPVESTGALALTATATTVFVLHAYGKGGEKDIAKILIVG